MEGVEEIVEDWADLNEQVKRRVLMTIDGCSYIVAAIILLARELRDYRRWAEEYHST